MRQIIFVMALAHTIIFPAAAYATPPARDLLEIAIREEIPSYLDVKKLDLHAPSKGESATGERLIYQFDAELGAAETLYASTHRQGPFIIAVETLEAEATFHVAGILDAREFGTDWDISIAFTQDFQGQGRPVGYFDGPVLIVGEPETEAKLKQLEIGILESESTAIRREIEEKLEEIRAEGLYNLQVEREKNAAELLQTIADHAATRGEIVARQTQEISELQAGLAAERQSLQRQVAQAKDVLDFQEQLTDLTQRISENDKAALELFAKMRSERMALLNTLPKVLRGVVVCQDNSSPPFQAGHTLEITLGDVFSSGFKADFLVVNVASSEGSAAILADVIAFPLDIVFSAPALANRGGVHFPSHFSLQLHSNGRMVGETQHAESWIRTKTTPTTCRFELSI